MLANLLNASCFGELRVEIITTCFFLRVSVYLALNIHNSFLDRRKHINASCERGFSTVKRIKNDWSCRLATDTLDMLIWVDVESQSLLTSIPNQLSIGGGLLAIGQHSLTLYCMAPTSDSLLEWCGLLFNGLIIHLLNYLNGLGGMLWPLAQ